MRRVCLLSAWFRERIHTSGVSEFLLNGLVAPVSVLPGCCGSFYTAPALAVVSACFATCHNIAAR